MKTFKQFIEESNACTISKSELYSKMLGFIKDKPTYNQGKPPANGEIYGIDGTAESWAKFYTELAGHESGYNVCKPFKDHIKGVPEPGGSGGLFQLGRDQIEIWATKNPSLAKSYGLEPGRNYTEQEILTADLSIRGMAFIGDALLRQNYAVGPRIGLGRTIGVLSWNKIAKKAPTSTDTSGSMYAKSSTETSPGETSSVSTGSREAGRGPIYTSVSQALGDLWQGAKDFSRAAGWSS